MKGLGGCQGFCSSASKLHGVNSLPIPAVTQAVPGRAGPGLAAPRHPGKASAVPRQDKGERRDWDSALLLSVLHFSQPLCDLWVSQPCDCQLLSGTSCTVLGWDIFPWRPWCDRDPWCYSPSAFTWPWGQPWKHNWPWEHRGWSRVAVPQAAAPPGTAARGRAALRVPAPSGLWPRLSHHG